VVEAAKKLGVSRAQVQRRRKVREEGVPELLEAVDKGAVKVFQAHELLKLDKDEQRAAVAEGADVKAALDKAMRQPAPAVRELSDVQKAVRAKAAADNMLSRAAKLIAQVKALASDLGGQDLVFTANQREIGRDFGKELVTTGEWVQSMFATEEMGATDANLAALLREEGE
jgi:cell division septum initiation protein DivIVA